MSAGRGIRVAEQLGEWYDDLVARWPPLKWVVRLLLAALATAASIRLFGVY